MPYVLFNDHFPELAQRETRTITQLWPSHGLPAGQYGFLEMFCDEPGCDCRRVFFYVYSPTRHRHEAVIAYGWEDEAFYARWMGDDDPDVVAAMKGPILNLGSPQTELAPAVLALFEYLLLPDAAYMERVKRHYRLFREKIATRSQVTRTRRKERMPADPAGFMSPGPFAPQPPMRVSARPTARNAPCPCGSGRKYKKCCLMIG
jgi:hypothetical protein